MFQQLMAIPQEEYMQLTSVQQARQPVTQHFYKLERQYEEQDQIRDPLQRVLIQSETLDQMKDLKERMRQDITISTPKPYQTRARALFQSLEPFLKFNERGEIYNDQEQLIPESRLEDLVQHAVRDRRRSHIPRGWPQFVNLLQSHNVPKFMLNRDTLDDLNRRKRKSEDVEIKSEIPAKREIKEEVGSPEKAPANRKKRIKREPAKQRETHARKSKPKLDETFTFLQSFK